MVSRCVSAAAGGPLDGTSSHTTVMADDGTAVVGGDGDAASDIASRSASSDSDISVAPESASRTSSAATFTSAGATLVSSNS